MNKTASNTFFSDLVQRFHGRVYRVACRIVGSEADAADVTQQVFLHVLEKDSEGQGFRNPEARLTWLASRFALNHLRGERRRQRREEEYAMSRKSDYEDLRVDQDEEARVLRRELYQLPEPQRLCVVLCCQEGLTLASAAELMSCAESTIHARIKQGLARLKASLERHGIVIPVAALPKLMSSSELVPVPSGLEGRLLSLGGGHPHLLLSLSKLKAWALPLVVVAVAFVSSIPFWSGGTAFSVVPEVEAIDPLSIGVDSKVAGSMALQPGMDYGIRVPVALPAEPLVGGNVPAPQSKVVKVGIRVVDGTGKAVVDAGVEVLSEYRSLVTARTDKEGKATLEIPGDASVQWILALKSGVGFDYYEHYESNRLLLTPLSKLTGDIKLVLDGAKKIRIHAENATGTSLPGVVFVPWLFSKPKSKGYINLTGSKLAVTKTDQKGAAVFDWIPPLLLEKGDPPTGFCLFSDSYTWPDQDRRILYSKTDLTVKAVLQRNLRVTGRVTDPKGQGAGGVLVVAEGRGLKGADYCRAETRSGSTGGFSLLLAPGQQYIVTVMDRKWAANALHFELEKEGLAKPIQLKLCRGTLIHGTVLNRSDSTPIPDMRVNLIARNPLLPDPGKNAGILAYANGGLVVATKTDRSGRFEFRVSDGDYFITAHGAMDAAGRGSLHKPTNVKIRGQLERKHDLLFHGGAVPELAAPIQVLPGSTKIYEFWMLKDESSLKNANSSCSQCHAPQRG